LVLSYPPSSPHGMLGDHRAVDLFPILFHDSLVLSKSRLPFWPVRLKGSFFPPDGGGHVSPFPRYLLLVVTPSCPSYSIFIQRRFRMNMRLPSFFSCTTARKRDEKKGFNSRLSLIIVDPLPLSTRPPILFSEDKCFSPLFADFFFTSITFRKDFSFLLLETQSIFALSFSSSQLRITVLMDMSRCLLQELILS